MNANHARPMLAFWLLAAVAAVVTSVGLHEGGSRVSVRAAAPLPVRSPDSAPLLLGGNLRPVPTLSGTPSPGTALPSMASLQAAAGRASQATARSTATTPVESTKTGGSATTRTRANSTPVTRPTRQPRPSGSTSSPAAATVSPTGPGNGRGQAHGHGSAHGHGTVPATAPSAGPVAGQSSGPGNHGRGHGPTAPGRSGH